MKKYSTLILLLMASASYGQQLTIDSMDVDESLSRLYLFGSFGSDEGRVTVDSVGMNVLAWSENSVTTEIPQFGRGSEGAVIVESGGQQTAPLLLTYWSGYINFGDSSGSQSDYQYDNRYFVFSFRFNVNSLIENGQLIVPKLKFINNSWLLIRNIQNTNSSDGWETYKVSAALPLRSNDSDYSYGFSASATFLADERYVLVKIYGISDLLEEHDYTVPGSYSIRLDSEYVPQADFECRIPLDSALGIRNLQSYYDLSLSNNSRVASGNFTFPPLALLQLLNQPSLLFPPIGSLYSYRNTIDLHWKPFAYMTSYHLQASPDSLFEHGVIDTALTADTCLLPQLLGLTQYFWRVAGVNSEGESRWSDVWSFTTGETAAAVAFKTSGFNFCAYPNPASDKLKIAYFLPGEDVTVSLYDMLGNKVRSVMQKQEGAQTIELPLTGLPAALYLLELQSAGVHKSMPISILR